MTDIEIAKSISGLDIKDVAKKINLDDNLILYGNDKAKIKKESHRVSKGVSLNRNKDTDAIYDLINEHYW